MLDGKISRQLLLRFSITYIHVGVPLVEMTINDLVFIFTL